MAEIERAGTSPDIQNPLEDSQNEEMKKLIISRRDTFNAHRRSRMLQTKANIAYLVGYQNIQITNNTIVPLPQQYATSVVANLILPSVVNDIAISQKVPPMYDIVPAGTAEDDRATAKACQKILPFLQRVNKKDLHRSSVILWYDLDGVGWRKVWWNPKWKVTGFEEDGQPIYEGEVRVEHVPNNELIFDHRVKNLNNLDWIIHAKTVTVGFVRQHFGEEVADNLPKTNTNSSAAKGNDEFEVEIMSSFQNFQENVHPPSPKNETDKLVDEDKEVDYYEYWHKPSASLPQGAFSVMIGETIVMNVPFPIDEYPHNDLPIVPCVPIELSGIQAGSISRISQARPMQREYNKLRSLIMDNLDAMGNSVMMVPRTTQVEFKKVTNQPGNIIEYEGPLKPTREAGVPIPGALFGYIHEVKSGIEEIFAFHEPSKGQMPVGGPKSARGLEALQMADFTQLGPIIEALEESDQRVVHQMLTLAITNYSDKIVNIVGEDQQWTLQRLDKSQLQGKINVIIRRGSSTPYNREMEAQRAFQVWQSGLMGDPMDSNVRLHTLKQMDLGNIENILQVNAKDTNWAMREFLSSEQLLKKMPPISKGMSPEDISRLQETHIFLMPPNSFDNHQVHIHEHRMFIMDNYHKYMQLGSISDGDSSWMILMQAMIMHTNMHHQIVAENQANAMLQEATLEAFKKGKLPDQILMNKLNLDKGKEDSK